MIANQVASPIEAQLNGIDNLLYFSSTSSSSGNVSINVVFKPGSDPDINQVNVQNRVSQALSLLPQTVTQQGVAVEKQSSSIMMVLSIYSPDDRYSSTYIDNYTNLYVLDELKRVPGANRASVFGLPDIAMRVWLQPDRMAQLGITVQDVAAALQSQNQTFGIGQIGGQPSVPGHAADVRHHGAGPAHQARAVRGHHRARRQGRRGDGAPARHRPGRARQARLLDREPHERQGRRPRSRSTSSPAPTRWRRRPPCASAWPS